MDAMGMGLCVAFIAFVRLPSLKVSTLLLSGLLLYDVFWVFFSQYVFSANVMVKVRRTIQGAADTSRVHSTLARGRDYFHLALIRVYVSH